MNFKQTTFLFALITFLLICVFPFDVEAQRKRTAQQKPCNPDEWIYRKVTIDGRKVNEIYLIKSGVTIQLVDENGNLDSKGGFLRIVNDGSESIQWDGYAENAEVEAGGEDSVQAISYQSVKNPEPVVATITIKYKCNTKAPAKNPQNKQVASNNRSQAVSQNQVQQPQQIQQMPVQPQNSQRSISLADNIVGCWRTYGSSGQTGMIYDNEYTASGEIKHGLVKSGDNVLPPEKVFMTPLPRNTYRVTGNRLTLIREDGSEGTLYDYEGGKLYIVYDGSRTGDYSVKIPCGAPF